MEAALETTPHDDHPALVVLPIANLPAAVADPGPLDRNPCAAYLMSLSPGAGRISMTSTARVLAAELGYDDALSVPWSELRFPHAAALRGRLVESGRAPATCNKFMACLRGIMRQAWLLGQITAEEHARIKAVGNVRGSRLPAGRALDGGELVALFAVTADGTPAGARDACAFAMLYAAGLRRAEAVAVTLDDVDAETGSIRIVGKGGRERETYVQNGGLTALQRWLDVRGDTPGPVLCPIDKRGVVFAGRSMTPQSVRMRLRRRALQAKINLCSPHDLRRTFVGDLLDAGADLASVQALAGHASPSTTSRYDRRPAEARRRAAGLLRVPVA